MGDKIDGRRGQLRLFQVFGQILGERLTPRLLGIPAVEIYLDLFAEALVFGSEAYYPVEVILIFDLNGRVGLRFS